MKIVKPGNTDPIPLHSPQQSITTILIRFVAFLMVAIAVLLLAWIR